MAIFKLDTDPHEDLAYRLLLESPVTLVHRRSVLDATTTWLTEHGYQLVPLAAGEWRDDADLHRDVATALDFPSYYGRNLSALNDCLRDVTEDRAYGWAPSATGLVVVLIGFDAFLRVRPATAHVLLGLLAEHSRVASLTGGRLLTLVQSDDPVLTVGLPPRSAVEYDAPPSHEPSTRSTYE